MNIAAIAATLGLTVLIIMGWFAGDQQAITIFVAASFICMALIGNVKGGA